MIVKFLITRAAGTGASCLEKLWVPLPGRAQGQVGRGFGQPDLVGGVVPAAGGWNEKSFTIPSTPNGSVIQIKIQLAAAVHLPAAG